MATTRPHGSMRQSRWSAASPRAQIEPSPVVIEHRHMRMVVAEQRLGERDDHRLGDGERRLDLDPRDVRAARGPEAEAGVARQAQASSETPLPLVPDHGVVRRRRSRP